MSRVLIWPAIAGILLFICPTARAQTTQFWPEVNFYKRLNTHARFFFLAKVTKENRESSSLEVGPNIDFYFPPLLQLRRLAGFDVDESKSRPLTLRVGYRYLPTIDSSSEHRGVIELTPRIPLIRGAVISDRSRVDIRFINGDSSWRYRNRLSIERAFALRSQTQLWPYVRVEAYYDSRHEKWSRTAFDAGVGFSFARHWELEAYYSHENDSGGSPNQQTHGIGLVLGMHF